MVTPGFGFSVGDFIAVIKLARDVARALKDTAGATDDFRMLQQELHQYVVLLEHIQYLPSPAAGSLTHHNAVRGMALTVQQPLHQLLKNMEDYRPALGAVSRVPKWKQAKRKIQWTVEMQEEVMRVRRIVTTKIVSLTTLMLLPCGAALQNIESMSLEQKAISYQLAKDICDVKESVTTEIDETRQYFESTVRGTAIDTSRLLKICAGIQIGVQKLDRRAHTAARNNHRYQKITARRDHALIIAVNSTAATLQDHASQTITLVESLLRCFTTFSKDVLERLKQLHLSNIEIYALLCHMQERLPRAPTSFVDDNIIFIDALNRKQSLPYSVFQHWEVFEAMLLCQFKATPGEGKVVRGEYRIFNSKQSGVAISMHDWKRRIFPGTNLDMSMVMLMTRYTTETCPRPFCTGIGRKIEGKNAEVPYTCQTCDLHFLSSSVRTFEPPGPTRKLLDRNPQPRIKEIISRPSWRRRFKPLFLSDRLCDPRAMSSLQYLYVCLKFMALMKRNLRNIRRRQEEEGLVVFSRVEIEPQLTPNTWRRPVLEVSGGKYGSTRLARASEQGNLVEVIAAYNQEPNDLDRSDYRGFTPLHKASIHGWLKVVQFLVDRGCEVEAENRHGETPLMCAVAGKHLDVVRFLLSRADVHHQSKLGYQAIYWIHWDDESAREIEELLKEAMRRTKPPGTQDTLISKAEGDILILGKLINSGVSPLVEAGAAAVGAGHYDVLSILLASDMTYDTDRSSDINTLMLAAIGRGHLKIIQLLLEQDSFNPRRMNMGRKYYFEISEQRRGPNWE
ncbi:ankyrin [Lojkania enalia]|uniref:Ankyrin n=1 Tax=Lojkania enalia TaxID=147567 RepID=A0A9P4K5C9_9PLEO|nr:ankyrin [Didymosphaeria enalia]